MLIEVPKDIKNCIFIDVPKFVKLVKFHHVNKRVYTILCMCCIEKEAYREGLTVVYQISFGIWPTEMQCNCI